MAEEDAHHQGSVGELNLAVRHIGGIDRLDASFRPGVSILEGRNATNRTSLLTALADILGGSSAALKTTADSGHIRLAFDEGTFEREFRRENGRVAVRGDQYSDKTALVDLFVRVLKDNPIRRAVERGENLRSLLLEPVDTAQIERNLSALSRERDSIDEEIESLERELDNLPSLEEQLKELRTRMREVNERIEAIEEEIDANEASEKEAERAEELLEDLEAHRDELHSVTEDINRQEEHLTRLREEREQLEQNIADIDVPESDIERNEQRLDELQRNKQTLDDRITQLQQIVQFNDRITSGDGTAFFDTTDSSDVTADLTADSREMECWTCGSTVEVAGISQRIQELRDVIQEFREDRKNLDQDIAELEDRVEDLRTVEEEKQRLEKSLQRTVDKIDVRESKLEELEHERSEIEENIDAVEREVDETEELRENDLIESYKRLSELEYKRGRIEREESTLVEERDRIDEFEDVLGELRSRREDITDEMNELRSKIENLEKRSVEYFNDHMEQLLDALGYDNIARMWIERYVQESDENLFQIHVVRETDGGTVFEDTIDTLSESEREVIGLVVALSGYLAYEVYDEIPVMMLDSVEAIDAARLDSLIQYFENHVRYLIVALLPEDAQAIGDDFEQIPAKELQSTAAR